MIDITKYKTVNDDKIKSQKTLSSRLSILRLLSFGGIVYFAYIGSKGTSYGTTLSLVCILLFVGMIFIHQKSRTKLEQSIMYNEVLEEIEVRKTGGWDTLDYGQDFSSDASNNSYDLDLLGEHSLYQRISIAQTFEGKSNLKGRLLNGLSKSEMKKQQESLVELSDNVEACLKYMSVGKIYNRQFFRAKRKKEFPLDQLIKDQKPFPKSLKLFTYLINLVMICLLVLYVLNMLPSSYFMLCFLLSTVLTLAIRFNDKRLSSVYDLAFHLSYMQPFLEVLSTMDAKSELLSSYVEESKEATKAFSKLQQVSTLLSINNDNLIGTIVNGFTLMHIHLSSWMGNWLTTYSSRIEGWLAMIGDVEAMISLLQVEWTLSDSSLPNILDQEKLHLSGTEIVNPLIASDQVVSYTFQSDTQSYIVTGSNMSGKTTFMRSLAIQMTLMQAGGYVCASSFSATPMQLYTSMRIKDEVKEGVSTFYAEILRIKDIMNAKDERKPMLVMIDEIFKGTNTEDRIICAKETIRQLSEPWCMLFLTTHDTELCELEKEGQLSIHNYYFKESYDDGKIIFDYLLRDGISDTKNAQALMRLAGIMK